MVKFRHSLVKKIKLLFLIIYPFSLMSAFANPEYDLQAAINRSTSGQVSLPGGVITITNPIIVPSNLIINGNNTIIVNQTNDYAIKIIGKEKNKTVITQDIISGGGIPNKNPKVTVKNASMFKAGDFIKIVKDDSIPLRIEFNIIKSIIGNELTFKKRFIQSYYKKDNIKVISLDLITKVLIKDLEITSTPDYSSYGIYAKNSGFLSVNNVTVHNITRKSIHVEHSYMPEIINNQFIENGSGGKGDYGIGSVLNMGATISANKLFMSGAIYLKGNVGSSVLGNALENPGATGGDAISIVSTFHTLFQNNVIIVPNCYGVWMLHGSENNIIANNNFFSGITSGIYLSHNVSNNVISNNFLDNNNGNGIFLDFTADNNMVENNLATNNKGRGILVHGSNNIIKGNVAQNNILENIKVIPDKNNVLDNNIF